jgi:hypothetical protein
MRTLHLAVFSVVSAMSLPSLAASSEQPDARLAQKAAAISAAADSYTLSDGRQLQLVQHGDRLYAEQIRREPVELFQVSENGFATKDKSLQIEIKFKDEGEKEVVVEDSAPSERPPRRWRLI